jgi:hypothetical protein
MILLKIPSPVTLGVIQIRRKGVLNENIYSDISNSFYYNTARS